MRQDRNGVTLHALRPASRPACGRSGRADQLRMTNTTDFELACSSTLMVACVLGGPAES